MKASTSEFAIASDALTSSNSTIVIGGSATTVYELHLPEGTLGDASFMLAWDSGDILVESVGVAGSVGVVSSKGALQQLVDYAMSNASSTGQVQVDFDQLVNSDTDNSASESVLITVVFRLSAASEAAAGSSITFTASHSSTIVCSPCATHTQSLQIVASDLVGSGVFPPALASDVDAFDTLTWNVSVEHTQSSTANAFNLTFFDNSSAAGVIYDIESVRVFIDAVEVAVMLEQGNPSLAASNTSFAIVPVFPLMASTLTLEYTIKTLVALPTGSFFNTGLGAVWYLSPIADGAAAASLGAKHLTFAAQGSVETKSISAAVSAQRDAQTVAATTAANQVVVGSVLEVLLVITVPQGTTSDAEVSIKWAGNAAADGMWMPSVGDGGVVASEGSPFVVSALGTIAPGLVLVQPFKGVNTTLGSTANSNTNNSAVDQVKFRFQVGVLDAPSVSRGSTANLQCTISWSRSSSGTGPMPRTDSCGSVAFVVAEPTIDQSVAVTPLSVSDVDAGDVVRYSAVLRHAGISDAAAVNLTLSDAELAFSQPGYSLETVFVNGAAVPLPVGPSFVIYSTPALNVGEGDLSIVWDVRVTSGVEFGSDVTGSLWVSWATLGGVEWRQLPFATPPTAQPANFSFQAASPIMQYRLPLLNTQQLTDEWSPGAGEVVVGSSVSYLAELVIPEGVAPELQIVLAISTLQQGSTFMSGSLFTAGVPMPALGGSLSLSVLDLSGGDLSSSCPGGLAGAAAAASINATHIIVDLCDITNSASSNNISEPLQVRVDGVVRNLASTVDGTQVVSAVQVLSTSLFAPLYDEIGTLTVREGALEEPVWSIDPGSSAYAGLDGGDTLTLEASIQHLDSTSTGGPVITDAGFTYSQSSAHLFNVTVLEVAAFQFWRDSAETDSLQVLASTPFVKSTPVLPISSVSWLGSTLSSTSSRDAHTNSGNLTIATFDTFNQGFTASTGPHTLQVRAELQASLPSGVMILPRVAVQWRSHPTSPEARIQALVQPLLPATTNGVVNVAGIRSLVFQMNGDGRTGTAPLNNALISDSSQTIPVAIGAKVQATFRAALPDSSFEDLKFSVNASFTGFLELLGESSVRSFGSLPAAATAFAVAATPSPLDLWNSTCVSSLPWGSAAANLTPGLFSVGPCSFDFPQTAATDETALAVSASPLQVGTPADGAEHVLQVQLEFIVGNLDLQSGLPVASGSMGRVSFGTFSHSASFETTTCKLQIVEPALAVPTLSPALQGDAVAGGNFSYTFTLQHVGASASPAYNLAVFDSGVASGQYYIGLVEVDGMIVVNRTATGTPFPGSQGWLAAQPEQVISFTDAALVQSLALGSSSHVRVTCFISETANVAEDIKVAVSVMYASHPASSSAQNYSSATAEADVLFDAPPFRLRASTDGATPDDSSVTIGSSGHFSLDVTFPLGVVANSSLLLRVADDLVAASLFSYFRLLDVQTINAGLSFDCGGGATAFTTENVLGQTRKVGNGSFDVDLCTVSNSLADGGGSIPVTIVFEYTIANDAAVQAGLVFNGTALINTAAFTLNNTIAGIVVVEPLLQHASTAQLLAASGTGYGLSAGDYVTYAFESRHAASSTSSAYGLVLRDPWLRESSQIISGSQAAPSGVTRLLLQLASLQEDGVYVRIARNANDEVWSKHSLGVSAATDVVVSYAVAPGSSPVARHELGSNLTLTYWSHPNTTRGRQYFIKPSSPGQLVMGGVSLAGNFSNDGISGHSRQHPVATIGSEITWTGTISMPLSTLLYAEWQWNSTGSGALAVSNSRVSMTGTMSLPLNNPAAPSASVSVNPALENALRVFLPSSCSASQLDVVTGSADVAAALAQGDPSPLVVTATSTEQRIYPCTWSLGLPRTAGFNVDQFQNVTAREVGQSVQLDFVVHGVVSNLTSASRGKLVQAEHSVQSPDLPSAIRHAFDPVVVVEPDLDAIAVSPLAVADVDAGDEITFELVVAHSALSDSTAHQIVLSDSSLVRGTLDFVSLDGTAVSFATVDARAYDLVRVQVDGTVQFAESSVDVSNVQYNVTTSGVFAIIPALEVAQTARVRVTVRLWAGVAAATAVRPQIRSTYLSCPENTPHTCRVYQQRTLSDPVIGVKAPAIAVAVTTDAATFSNDYAAVGATWRAQAEVALPQGTSSQVVVEFNFTVSLAESSAGVLPVGVSLLGNLTVDTLQASPLAAGLVSIDTVGCPSMSSSGILTGPDFLPQLAPVQSSAISAANGNQATEHIVRVPLCNVRNTESNNNITHSIMVYISGNINGSVLPLSEPLRGSSIIGTVRLLSAELPATPPTAGAGVIAGAAVVPSAVNISATLASVLVVEPRLAVSSASSSHAMREVGSPIEAQLVVEETGAAHAGTAFHVRLVDALLSQQPISKLVYTPVSVDLLGGQDTLQYSDITSRVAAIESNGGDLLRHTATSFHADGASLQAASSGALRYIWRFMQGAPPGVSVQPGLGVAYSSHFQAPDLNPFVRHYPIVGLSSVQQGALKVKQPFFVQYVSAAASPSTEDAAATQWAVAPGLPSNRLASLGQRVTFELRVDLPMGLVADSFVVVNATSIPYALAHDASISVQAITSSQDVTNQINLTNCNDGQLNGLSNAPLSDLAPGAVRFDSEGRLSGVSLCDISAQPGIGPLFGQPFGDLARVSHWQLRLKVHLTLNGSVPSVASGTALLHTAAIRSLSTDESLSPLWNGSVVQKVEESIASILFPATVVEPALAQVTVVRGLEITADAFDLLTTELRVQHAIQDCKSSLFKVRLRDESTFSPLFPETSILLDGVDITNTVQLQAASDALFVAELRPQDIFNVTITRTASSAVQSASAYTSAWVVSWASHPVSPLARDYRSGNFSSVSAVTLPSVTVESHNWAQLASSAAQVTSASVGQKLKLVTGLAFPEGYSAGQHVNISLLHPGTANLTAEVALLAPSELTVVNCSHTPAANLNGLSRDPQGSWVALDVCALQNSDFDNGVLNLLQIEIPAVVLAAALNSGESSGNVTALATVNAAVEPGSTTLLVQSVVQLSLQQSLSPAALSTGEAYNLFLNVTAGSDNPLLPSAKDVFIAVATMSEQVAATAGADIHSMGGTLSVSQDTLTGQSQGDLQGFLVSADDVVSALQSVNVAGPASRRLQSAGTFDVRRIKLAEMGAGAWLAANFTFQIPERTAPGTKVRHVVVVEWASVAAAASTSIASRSVLSQVGTSITTVTCDKFFTCSGNGMCLSSNKTGADVLPFIPATGAQLPQGTVFAAASQCACASGWYGPSCCMCDPGADASVACSGRGVCVAFGQDAFGISRGGQCVCDDGFADSSKLDPFCRGTLCNDAPEQCAVVRGTSHAASLPAIGGMCASDCAVGEWSNFTSSASMSALGRNMTRIRNVTAPSAYGGNACPALLDEALCTLPECVQPSSASTAKCDVSSTGFRLSAALPADVSQEQILAAALFFVLAVFVVLAVVLCMLKHSWVQRNDAPVWHVPVVGVSSSNQPLRARHVSHTVQAPLEAAPVGSGSDTDDASHPAQTALPASSQQLWWNWRNVIIIAMISTDGLMAVAPLFIEQVPWHPYIPVKVVARVFSLAAVKVLPVFSSLYALFFVGVCTVVILAAFHERWRHEALQTLRRVSRQKARRLRLSLASHGNGTLPPGTGVYPRAIRDNSTESVQSATSAQSDLSSRSHRRLLVSGDAPVAIQNRRVSMSDPHEKMDAERSATIASNPDRSNSNRKNSDAIGVGVAPGGGAQANEHPSAKEEVIVARSTVAFTGAMPVVLYALGTVLLVPALVVVLQPLTCGFPFGGASLDSTGACLESACWDTLHALMTFVAGCTAAALMIAALVWLPRRMHLDRTLETHEDMMKLLSWAVTGGAHVSPTAHHSSEVDEAACDIPSRDATGANDVSAGSASTQRLRSLSDVEGMGAGPPTSAQLTDAMIQVARRWRQRLEARPRVQFLAWLACLKLLVAWAGVVLSRVSVLGGLLVGCMGLTAFAVWVALRPAAAFPMTRLQRPAKFAYVVASLTGWLLLLSWATAPTIPAASSEQATISGDVTTVTKVSGDADDTVTDNTDMYAVNSAGVLAAACLWLVGALGAIIVVLVLDKREHNGQKLFRVWNTVVGPGVSAQPPQGRRMVRRTAAGKVAPVAFAGGAQPALSVAPEADSAVVEVPPTRSMSGYSDSAPPGGEPGISRRLLDMPAVPNSEKLHPALLSPTPKQQGVTVRLQPLSPLGPLGGAAAGDSPVYKSHTQAALSHEQPGGRVSTLNQSTLAQSPDTVSPSLQPHSPPYMPALAPIRRKSALPSLAALPVLATSAPQNGSASAHAAAGDAPDATLRYKLAEEQRQVQVLPAAQQIHAIMEREAAVEAALLGGALSESDSDTSDSDSSSDSSSSESSNSSASSASSDSSASAPQALASMAVIDEQLAVEEPATAAWFENDGSSISSNNSMDL